MTTIHNRQVMVGESLKVLTGVNTKVSTRKVTLSCHFLELLDSLRYFLYLIEESLFLRLLERWSAIEISNETPSHR